MASDHDAKVKSSLEYAQQVAAGERCEECGQFVYPQQSGRPRKCYGCRMLAYSTEEVAHDSRLRCPHCRGRFDVDELETGLFEGRHSVHCVHCERDFEVYTSVRFNYLSPKLEAPDGQPTV